MNCPYCDEGIHPMAKFCPKCGLPLNEDPTLMGNSDASEGGVKPWMIGAGAATIVAVAMCIGWASVKGSSDNGSVRREPVSVANPSPIPPTVGGLNATGPRATAAPQAAFGAPTMPMATPLTPTYSPQTSSKPPVTVGAQVHYAYTPPVKVERPRLAPQFPDPEAPRHVLTMNPYRARGPQYAVAVRPNDPEIPGLPPSISSPYMFAMPTAANAPPHVQGSGGTRYIDDPNSDWTYDPVQDRWALRPDRRPRTAPRGGIGNAP
jgi:hypothetical protein